MIGGIGLNLFTTFPNEGINLLVEFSEQPTRERLVAWLRSMVFDQALVTEELIEDRWRRFARPIFGELRGTALPQMSQKLMPKRSAPGRSKTLTCSAPRVHRN